jgi:hypothetical protein
MRILTVLLLFTFDANAGIEKICDQIDKVAQFAAPLINGYMPGTAMTPSGPVPIVAMGLIQQDSVILSFCNMYMQMKRSVGLDKVRLAANYANTLTGNKFDNHFQMLDDTMTFSERAIGFGKLDGSSLDKVQAFAPAMNSYLGSINTYNESISGSEIDSLKSRSKNEADINGVIASSTRLAVLNSMQNKCAADSESSSSGQLGNFNYLTEKRSMYESDMEYLLDKLNTMSIKFSVDAKAASAFQKESSVLWTSGSMLKSDESELITGSKNKTKQYKKYQVWSIDKFDDNKINGFDNKYSKLWADYVKSMYFDDSRGFLDDRTTRIQMDFYDYAFECRDSKLLAMLDRNGAFTDQGFSESQQHMAPLREVCLAEHLKISKEIKNIFHDYVLSYWSTYKLKKELDATIWTLESRFKGVFRATTSGQDPLTGAKSEVVVCADNPNTLEQLVIANQNKSLKMEMKQKLLDIKIKQNIARDEKKSQEAGAADANERKRLLEIEADKKVSPDMISSGVSKARI